MTPAEWNSSADPDAMLAAAGERISDRKLLFFGCAAARRNSDILPLFVTTLLPHVETAAEAPTAEERAELLRASVRSTGSIMASALVSIRSNVSILEMVRNAATGLRSLEAQSRTSPLLANIASLFTAPFVNRPSPEQASLLRCVAGYPLTPAAFDPSWRTGRTPNPPSTACPFWPTRCRTPGATTTHFSTTSAPPSRTPAGAGRSTSSWARSEVQAACGVATGRIPRYSVSLSSLGSPTHRIAS